MTIAACSIVTSSTSSTDNNSNNIDRGTDKLPEQHNKNQEVVGMSLVESTRTGTSTGNHTTRERNKSSESSSEDSESSGLGGSQKDHTLNTDDESEILETMTTVSINKSNKQNTLGNINEMGENDKKEGDEFEEDEDATQGSHVSYDDDCMFDEKKEIIDDIIYEERMSDEENGSEEKRDDLKDIYENSTQEDENGNEEVISNDENIDPVKNNCSEGEILNNTRIEEIADEDRSQHNNTNNYTNNNETVSTDYRHSPSQQQHHHQQHHQPHHQQHHQQIPQPLPEGTYINGVWIPNNRLSQMQQHAAASGMQFQPIPGFPQYLVPPPVQMLPPMVPQVSPSTINSQPLQGMASNDNTLNNQKSMSIPTLQAFIMPQHLYPYFVDNRFSEFRNIIATGPTTINAPIPNEEGYDLFLHLQEGESISLCVGSPEMSKLSGPISMRWVARPGVIPTALPLVVPPGHIVQQLIDERGILRHMILSPDPTVYHKDKEKNNTSITINCGNVKPQGNISNSVVRQKNHPTPTVHFNTNSININKQEHRNPPQEITQRNSNYHNKVNKISPGGNNYNNPTNKNYIPNNNPPITTPNIRQHQQQTHHHPNAGHSGSGNQNNKYLNTHPRQQHQQQYDNNNQQLIKQNMALDECEVEYLRQLLSSINPPQIIRCGAREAEISWSDVMSNDTLSRANNNNITLHVTPSDFTYEVFLYEHSETGRLIFNQTTDNTQLKMKLLKLKPFTNYWVNMRVALIDYDIYGSPSKYLSFKTNASVPDAPSLLKCISKSATWVQITWKSPNNNGSPITNFIVQFAKNKLDPFDKVWEGLSDTCKVTDLEPSSNYRVRIIAVNSEGNSEPSPMIPVNTYGVHKNTVPSKPPNLPTVMEVTSERVKIRWDETHYYDNKNYHSNKNNQHHFSLTYTLEMCEVNDKVISKLTTVPKQKYIFNTAIVDVAPDKEYQFRIAVSHPSGSCVRSDWVTVHTPSKDGNIERFSEIAPKGIVFMPTPINLKRLRTLEHDVIEIGWQYPGKEDVYYILEGCYSTDCVNWKVIYNGKMNSYVNKDTKLSAFRVRAVNPENHSSAWSEVMFAVRKKISTDIINSIGNDSHSTTNIIKPPCSAPPKFSHITSNSIKVSWKLVFFNSSNNDNNLDSNVNDPSTPHYSINSFIASNTPVFYELQRVEETPIIIYSGDVSEYTIENLKPLEHVQLRVRAVAIDKIGVRSEGDWSLVSSCCTLPSLPSKPIHLKVQTVSGALGKNKCSIKLLIWNQPLDINDSDIIEYKIYKHQDDINENASTDKKNFDLFTTTTDTNLMIDDLIGNQKYSFYITIVTSAGESVPSDIVEFITEQSVPLPPSVFEISDITPNSFEVSWNEPKGGNFDITKYCLEIYNANKCESLRAVRDGETIPIEIFYTEPDVNNKVITDLKAETPYYVKIYAMSKAGKGIEVIKLVNTLPKPPQAPVLNVLVTASNFLKLKINAPNDVNYFSIEQEIDGDYEEIYHGELRTVKAKNLDENTSYNFRARAAYNQSQQYGEYSSIFTFKTSHTPPPQFKSSLTITETAQGIFNIEWPHIKIVNGSQDQDDAIYYRLQITCRFGKEKNGEPWKTLYEGTLNSFIYQPDNGSTVHSKQLRIIVIKYINDIEVQSLPSSAFPFKPIVAHSVPDSPRKRNGTNNNNSNNNTNNNNKVEDSTSTTGSTSPAKINKSMIGSSKRRWWIVNFVKRHSRDVKMGAICIIVCLIIFLFIY
uniref:Fibronectin type-III domain-containing protein n=1 Tax=Parastrongyloides trichosuri TaxID=131310 RepID=A0A0N4ZW00_PARTI